MSTSMEKNRYARLSECEIDKMLSDKDAVATKKATQVAIRNLREYILETDWDIDIHDWRPCEIPHSEPYWNHCTLYY